MGRGSLADTTPRRTLSFGDWARLCEALYKLFEGETAARGIQVCARQCEGSNGRECTCHGHRCGAVDTPCGEVDQWWVHSIVLSNSGFAGISVLHELDELIAGERASGLCGRVGCRVVGHLDDANTLKG